jgi:hypothetical protein
MTAAMQEKLIVSGFEQADFERQVCTAAELVNAVKAICSGRERPPASSCQAPDRRGA